MSAFSNGFSVLGLGQRLDDTVNATGVHLRGIRLKVRLVRQQTDSIVHPQIVEMSVAAFPKPSTVFAGSCQVPSYSTREPALSQRPWPQGQPETDRPGPRSCYAFS
jgi:hypothetical protein